MSEKLDVSPLFRSILVGKSELKHRIAMAPLTRYRGDEDHVHHEIAAEYYGQRASTPGTLLVTEATFISADAGGYANVPGLWNEDQIAGWKKVTDAVHKHESFIYVQLWALGRAAFPKELEKTGDVLVSSSDVPLSSRPESDPKPKPLTKEEIKGYVQKYTTAAENAIKAGFDGVELHSANGYLSDQFIQTTSNKRTDEYGGSIENRTRFTLEVLASITAAIGEERTGIRLSPWSLFQDMRMSDPKPTFTYLVEQLVARHPKLAYLSLVKPHISGGSDADPNDPRHEAEHVESNDFILDIWSPRPVLIAGAYNLDTELAVKTAKEREGIIITYGRSFISNPDLPLRIKNGIEFTPYNRDTFYIHGPEAKEGYTDYPFHPSLKSNA